MSLKEKLMFYGFKETATRGKARYYTKNGERYAVVFAYRKGREYVLIVENEVFQRLGYRSIFLDDKTGKGMLVPCIQWESGHYERIHNFILPVKDGMQVDHINHNRFFCVKSNLRYCEASENAENKMKSMEKYPFKTVNAGNGAEGYVFELPVQSNRRDVITGLENLGLHIKTNLISGWTIMESHVFQSKVDGMLSYRDNKRLLLKGTGMEKFVYDIENDFRETIDLLIRYYILGDITKEEMHQMNLEHWRNKLDNAPNLK